MPVDYAQEHHNLRAPKKLKTGQQYRRIFVDSLGWLEGVDRDLDEPPHAKEILAATLESADLVVVPLIPESMAFRPTKRTIEEVIQPMGLPFIVVINNWDPGDGTGDLTDTRAWAERQGWPVASTVIRRYKHHTTPQLRRSGECARTIPATATATATASRSRRTPTLPNLASSPLG